ncbi:MAG: type II toxin-antitoxin system VapC family toxin [Methylotenera sp.]|jgi:predicted nucleic-acid-binding protein|uniref:type II toxin-antitoxin system VapC family toxin n=1 Tax=Methylotenera sp. TaxID=2051956 RepID=UPI002730E866|nr:type II toxin-antitoxin system VapC family toxin [Methylotenera sp.]MDP1660054.1 type II toxin-antitoxin system VapC family toxin [Methylotenera sp.]MDP1766878.1 type II toxin-antitoxin system VapC family toxin [Methylotenera sp.]MDP2231564.1 type II toxin-antitoxin system VapC family toxin [Methylotenera sp.]MDP3141767.1 type II toxin-antitoxin system VapC family toxin [Methylotenera sp.]
MKAVDTNVLARFFIDDPEDSEAAVQKPAAIQAMSQAVFVSISVILEFEWVMRGFYVLPRADITRVFKALCGLQHVIIEDRAIVLSVIEAHHQGLDFADALHLIRAQHCKAFVSFDQRLQKRAKVAGLQPVVEILK